MSLPLIMMGGAAGGLSAVLGIGGGIFIVPLLPVFTEMGHREAVATSLMTIWLIASMNSYFFHQKSLVNWKTVFVIGPSAAFGSYIAARLSFHLSERHLRVIFFVITVVFAVKTLWTPVSKRRMGLGAVFGVFIGGVSGMTGIGSGVFLSPLLLNWGGLKNSQLSPTANAVIMFTTLFGALAFLELPRENLMRWGLIHVDKVLILFVSASLCAHIGRKYQARVKIRWRKLILGSLLLVLAVQVLLPLL